MSTTYSSGNREDNRSGRGSGFRPFARRRTAPHTPGANPSHHPQPSRPFPQQRNQHGGNQPPSKEHFNWRSGGFSPSFLGFFILKTLQKHLPKNVFYNMILSLFLTQTKAKRRCCLVLPGFMQKVKKQMDFFLKKTVIKFASKSKKFADLAANNKICIVLENERSFKKLFVKTKVAWIKNLFISRNGPGKHSKQHWLEKSCTNLCALTKVNLKSNSLTDILFSFKGM